MIALDEYIKREAALSLVRPDAPEGEKAAVTIATAKKLVRDIVHRTPAADVAPVVHGRMVETDRPIRDGKSKVYGWECTACKSFTRSPFVDNWNYCPNCGARMDGSDSDDANGNG